MVTGGGGQSGDVEAPGIYIQQRDSSGIEVSSILIIIIIKYLSCNIFSHKHTSLTSEEELISAKNTFRTGHAGM